MDKLPTRDLRSTLRLPLVVAPMFLISGPELVIASVKAGLVGTLPSLNSRTTAIFDEWLVQIEAALEKDRAEGRRLGTLAVNLIVHPTNTRCDADVEVCVKHRVPIIFSAVGNPSRIIEPIHSYGGLVYADVSSVAHARKAVDAGADGLVLLCSGAGGNTGRLNPFAFVPEVRKFFAGPIAVAGAVGGGRSLRSLEMLGADFGYAGTAFIATNECGAEAAYQKMVVEAGADDIEENSKISGLPANFLRKSLDRIRAQLGQDHGHFDLVAEQSALKRWKDIWGAGHGVGASTQVEPVAAVVERFEREYRSVGGVPAWE